MLELLDLNKKVNAVHLIFAKELGLSIKLMDNGIQKIDSTMLDTYGIVLVAFLMTDKANRVRFFKKTFLVANVSLKIVLRIFFLILSSTNIEFLD